MGIVEFFTAFSPGELAALGALVVGAIVAAAAWTDVLPDFIKERIPDFGDGRNIVGVLGLALIAFAIMVTPLAEQVGLPQLAVGGEAAAPAAPTAPTAPSITGAATAPPLAVRQVTIESLSASIKAMYSNAYDSVAGTLEIYASDVDPSNPTANPIDTISISSGVGTTTNKRLFTDKEYRVVFNGANTWNDHDYGILLFSSANYNSETGVYGFADDAGVSEVASLDDFLAETDTGGDIFNGQSVNTAGSELYGTTDSIVYNETTGDGSVYVKPTLSVSGGNKDILDLVYCYKFDETNPPEGNEVSALIYQQESGVSMGFPSDLLPFWAAESCISLGQGAPVIGGTSSQVRFTYTLAEANLDTGADIWKEYLDDLGDINGKSVLLNTGATLDSVQWQSAT